MIGVRVVYEDVSVTVSSDAPFSPDLLDHAATVARRTIVATITDMAADEPEPALTWHEAMRKDMQLDND